MLLQYRTQREACRLFVYTRLNRSVPVLQVYFDEEKDLKEDYLLTRQSMNALIQLIHREKDHGWAVQLEILIFVYWLAHGLSFRLVARAFDVPASTTHRVVHNIAKQLMDNLGKAISLPKPEEMERIGQSFGKLTRNAAFSKAVGAIGCCHMHVKPSGNRCHVDYINDRLSFSIRLQAICDATGKFLDIFVGYPGSVHDSRVLKSSPLYAGTGYPPPGFLIVGDDGYPCLEEPICLITPYKLPLQERAQERFNLHLSRMLSVTQKSFGIMKTRWRSTLFKAIEVNPDFAPSVISACAFIHNVCLMNGDVVEPDPNLRNEVMGPLPPPDPLGPDERRGDLLRDGLCAQVSVSDVTFEHLEEHDYA
ncbi:INO80 complex subunit C isoform X2 [Conger conger]|uniref:INO80 complex subunit C isoform X2 n=1 Tax=Conger conger TaxID=82655 RepID=UPI002A5A9976|nr:INO80 complex subunit C isoform X2 [Conger conger]XP_061115513.1 INO80 complex subunit C isoform X2 [Conger conger]